MDEWLIQVEPMVHKSRIKVPYNWSVGETGSRFLVEIRDHKKFYGTRCHECNAVFVPPRKMCGRCFRETKEWVEVGPEGTLLTYTIVRYASELQPLKVPFGYGVIQLDGSATGMVHLLYEFNWEDIRAGMRVVPVFREHRTGHILDISYFRPL